MSVVERVRSYSVLDIIRRRRSVGQVTHEEPSREEIERLLEAATYAPCHHVSEPWHFFVLTGTARHELGNAMANSLHAKLGRHLDEHTEKRLWRERNKPLRAPVIIAVTLKGAWQAKGLLIENIEAAAAAVQNMLLAGEEMGLATLWRTGDAAYDPYIKNWFGLSACDHIIGFIYVGYPKVTRPMRVPTNHRMKTTWLA